MNGPTQRRSDGGRFKNHPPLPENDPQTQEIQRELDAALSAYMRTYLVDSDEQRQEHYVAVQRVWVRRYPEVPEGRRSSAFLRFMKMKR